MVKNIFVNLPVRNLKNSMEFFRSLGFTFNKKYTDETAACLVLGKNIFAMLLTEKKFKEFTKKEISDAKKYTEVLLAIDVPNKKEVDRLVEMAVEAGGEIYRDPDDLGFMYSRSFEDLDGHQWEVLWMDEKEA